LSAIYPIVYHYKDKVQEELPEFMTRRDAIDLLAEGIQENAKKNNCKGYIIPIKTLDYPDLLLASLKADINLALASYKDWQLKADEETQKEMKERREENLSKWGPMLSGYELERMLNIQITTLPNYSTKAKVSKIKSIKINDIKLIVYVYNEITSSEEFNVSVNFIHPSTLKQFKDKRKAGIRSLAILYKRADLSKKFLLGFVTFLILYILIVFIISLFQKHQIKKSKEYLLIEIEKREELVNNGHFVTALELADRYLKLFPDDTEIKAFRERLLDFTNNDPKKAQVAFVEAKKLQLRIKKYEQEPGKAYLTGDEKNALVPLLQYNPDLDSSYKRLVSLEEKEQKREEFGPKFENVKKLFSNCQLKQAEQELLTLQNLYSGYSELVEYQKKLEQAQTKVKNKFSSVQDYINKGEIRKAKQTLDAVLKGFNDMPEALKLKREFEEATGKEHFILKPSGKEKEIELICKDEVIIGRADIDVIPDIEFADRRISRPHLRISIVDDNVIAEDLDSAGGSFINGEKIVSNSINDGDLLNLAKFIDLQIFIYRTENDDVGGILLTGNSKNYLIIFTYAKFHIAKGNLTFDKDNYSIYHQDGLTIISTDKESILLKHDIKINLDKSNYNVEVIEC
jgi:hypothetical protein